MSKTTITTTYVSADDPDKPAHTPPWQVRWKRPRLDSVILGIDDIDGQDGLQFDDEDTQDIRDDWVPISCASVVLTRDEARRAILELHKSDKLLLKNRKRQQTTGERSSTRTPTKLNKTNKAEVEENTPRNSNVKKSIAISPSTLLSPSSWFKKSSERTQTQLASKVPKPTSTPDPKTKPPRFQSTKNKSERNILSPPSSNLFTTFSNVSSRQVKHSPTSDDESHTPPIITDASTASSLLWEDNTLTSVSEEDAVAFRMYENSKLKQISDAPPAETSTKKSDAGHDKNEKNESGRYYRDRNGNLHPRDFDGFDNAVLSVTIYATPIQDSNPSKDSVDRKTYPTSGDVIVMELLSTRNPPNLDSDVSPNRETSSSQSHPPPPPTVGDSDSSAISSASNSQQQALLHDEEESSSNHTRILSRRVLRWPSSIMSIDTKRSGRSTIYQGNLYCNSCGWPSFASLGRSTVWEERSKTGSKKCDGVNGRSPQPERFQCSDSEDIAADAVDAIHCLDFLFGESKGVKSSTEGNAISNKIKVANDNVATRSSRGKRIKMTQPLCMCFITSDGQALFFHAMRVFLSRSSKIHSVSNSFAALFFGEELLDKVCDDVIPLSQPNAILRLSQVTPKAEPFHGNTNTSPAGWDTIITKNKFENDGEFNDTETEVQPNEWSRLIDFDASIDHKSLQYRTLHRSNVITGSCVTSNTDNSFLVICGKGIHRSNSRKLRSPNFRLGGFVTFISLRHYSETRTIYVPFAVEHIQPMVWNGHHYVVLLGENGAACQKEADMLRPFAMTIRVDSKKTGPELSPARFQPVAVNLPSVSESLGSLSRVFFQEGDTVGFNSVRCRAACVSTIPSSPPGIILTFHSVLLKAPSTVAVVNCSLSSFYGGLLSTSIRPGQRINLPPIVDNELCGGGNIWCTGGQGWLLVGIEGNCNPLYYISWEGAADQGPYVLKLSDPDSTVEISATSKARRSVLSNAVPIMSVVSNSESVSDGPFSESASKIASLRFASVYSLPYFLSTDQQQRSEASAEQSCSLGLRNSILSAARNEGGIDESLISALGSISVKADRSKVLIMSHEQKSKRILQHCSSWIQLDDARANRDIIHGQVITTLMRAGAQTRTLTLRTNIVTNPLTTPYNQILSWLCQRRDYFTAAGVALSLLNDVEAVYELRGIPKDKCSDLIAHQGLLDGITPLASGDTADETKTLTSLADMTVGCMIKGGTSMASTLEGFLSRNTLYDSARASLMLVGAIAMSVSSEPEPSQDALFCENIVESLSKAANPSESVLWPLRCLLKMAVARQCLSSALLLLNSAIPNELRWRQPHPRGVATGPRPSLGLFVAVVQIIIESRGEATRALLDLFDEESGQPYWLSIQDDTRLALCIFSVNGKYLFIQEPECRAWILELLSEAIDSRNNRTGSIPDEWLSEVITGVFCNAECDISLGLDSRKSVQSRCTEEYLGCYREQMEHVRDLLVPQDDSGGLDFDILIPSLLLLTARGKAWREGMSSQVVLNAVSDLAGRKLSCDPRFIFDGRTVMQQCAKAENVQAASFLVGGRSGLVLECADLLLEAEIDISMKNAEIALFGGSLRELKEIMATLDYTKNLDADSIRHDWTPSKSQFHLLWLIEHHVINVNRYGDFDASSQGELTPVTAGRICFRAWLCLSNTNSSMAATKWLEMWLRQKLELKDGVSSKRLACAALVRVLLWADEECSTLDDDDEDELIISSLVGFDVKFLAELSHACVGLIQSIPPHLQSEVGSGLDGFASRSSTSAMFTFEVFGNHEF